MGKSGPVKYLLLSTVTSWLIQSLKEKPSQVRPLYDSGPCPTCQYTQVCPVLTQEVTFSGRKARTFPQTSWSSCSLCKLSHTIVARNLWGRRSAVWSLVGFHISSGSPGHRPRGCDGNGQSFPSAMRTLENQTRAIFLRQQAKRWGGWKEHSILVWIWYPFKGARAVLSPQDCSANATN